MLWLSLAHERCNETQAREEQITIGMYQKKPYKAETNCSTIHHLPREAKLKPRVLFCASQSGTPPGIGPFARHCGRAPAKMLKHIPHLEEAASIVNSVKLQVLVPSGNGFLLGQVHKQEWEIAPDEYVRLFTSAKAP